MKRITLIRAYIVLTFLSLQGCGSDGEDIAVDCSASGLQIQVMAVDYTDCGVENGRIELGASGGNPPYTFFLDNGASNSTGIFEELSTNYYMARVRDADNCEVSKQTFVGSNDGVRAVGYVTPSGCGESNGSIVVVARNGVEPYKYQLGENSDYTDENEFTGLPAGSYSVWVRDVNDCGLGIYLDIPSGISYSESLEEVFISSCASSGCHDGTVSPDLLTAGDIKDHSQAVLTSVLNRSMPPEETLTSEEILLIECWIKDGAPDN